MSENQIAPLNDADFCLPPPIFPNTALYFSKFMFYFLLPIYVFILFSFLLIGMPNLSEAFLNCWDYESFNHTIDHVIRNSFARA